MSIKPDTWIRRMALEKGMIEPFEATQVRNGISYGLGSYGYDFRLDRKFRIFRAGAGIVIDPKNASTSFDDLIADVCEIPPHSFVLAQTIEYFRIPRDVVTICYGKSTYARCGIHVNVTPFEPEWEGHATISITNANSVPAKIYAGEGIGQLLFLQSNEPCAVSYADKKGKYQAQKEITHAKGSG
ncbi:MAG: dCTP deaminase [Deltaproteobacteria bacterium RIFCSPLOWO2_02_FULL_44_10]|nr:MAG: dCTP deaminase [Deltaproteobacteria bacterium RIFCSPHIGHO2_02_FULL_44_16]OGQ46379.1 MAG: dCTP deaminase [Deltaproteobacteria bacterium RIFCSPLOWO2_02_FULL_44_10]